MAAISLPSVQPSFTGDSSSSTAGNGQLPTTPPASPPPATSIAVNEEEDDAVVVLIDTHHRRASRRAIRAIHHDEDDAHISDLLRAQADVDHRGHTRRVFLAHHQQIQLHPAPIVVHFKSQPMHILIHIFMDHFVGFDPKINHHKGQPDRFLLEPIRPSIFSKAAASISRHQQGLDQWIQAVHHAGHRPHHLPARIHGPPDAPSSTTRPHCRPPAPAFRPRSIRRHVPPSRQLPNHSNSNSCPSRGQPADNPPKQQRPPIRPHAQIPAAIPATLQAF